MPGFKDDSLYELALEAYLNALAPGSLQRYGRLAVLNTLEQVVEEAEFMKLMLNISMPSWSVHCYTAVDKAKGEEEVSGQANMDSWEPTA